MQRAVPLTTSIPGLDELPAGDFQFCSRLSTAKTPDQLGAIVIEALRKLDLDTFRFTPVGMERPNQLSSWPIELGNSPDTANKQIAAIKLTGRQDPGERRISQYCGRTDRPQGPGVATTARCVRHPIEVFRLCHV